jgi:hypothetical protein
MSIHPTPQLVSDFLLQYNDKVFTNALKLRDVIISNLPGITEQLDIPAKLIAYSYGQKYSELICVIIPSKKGLKLGFNRGAALTDPSKILEGSGKISRYVVITTDKQLKSKAIKQLLITALKLYKQNVPM